MSGALGDTVSDTLNGALRGNLRILCIGHADSPQFSQRCALLHDAGFRVTELTGKPQAVTPGADVLQPRGLPPGRAWRLTALSRFAHFFALVRGLRPDLIFVQYAQGLWAWLAVATGLPVVTSIMGGDVLFDEQADPGPAQRAATRGCVRGSALLLCKSGYLAEKVRALRPGGRVHVMAWGVDPQVFHAAPAPGEKQAARRSLGLPESGLLLVSPRALQPLYKISAIVRAFALSGLAAQGAHLALCTFRADPAYETGVRQLCRELGLEKAVTFLPPLDAQGMAQVYRAADLGVSVPDSDGLPQTFFEATACGLPLILRNLPNYRDTLRHGVEALLVDSSPEELSAALRLLAGDAGLREGLAQGATRFAKAHALGCGLPGANGPESLPALFQWAAARPGANRPARAAQLLRTAAALFSGPVPVDRQGQPVFPGLRAYFREVLKPTQRS